MTAEQIVGLGPALVRFGASFTACFFRSEVLEHFERCCRGLLSDLARKSVEPVALAGGSTARSLQEFLNDLRWDQQKCPSASAAGRCTSSGWPKANWAWTITRAAPIWG